MQQQLDEEQQEALAAAHSSRTASPTLQDEAVKEKRSELLGSNQELRRAVGQASAELSTARQQEAASNKLLQEQLLVSAAVLAFLVSHCVRCVCLLKAGGITAKQQGP